MTGGVDVQVTRWGRDVPDEVVAEVGALGRVVDAELDPGDPPMSDDEVAGHLRHPTPPQDTMLWLAHVGGLHVGTFLVGFDRGSVNGGFAETRCLEVHPDHRRRGVGSALARAAFADLASERATSVLFSPTDERGRRFCEHLGLTCRQEERQSRLVISELDQAQQDEWIAAPVARAAGYRVVTFHGPVPEEHLEAWSVAIDAMADAPLDEIDWAHDPYTPERVREIEAARERRGMVWVSSLALSADGEGAGMSTILLHPDRPSLAHQEDTAVVPAHRGHRLGRWLKAANLLAVLEAYPEVAVVQTYNAETNGPMLDINVAMGFRPHRTVAAYQAEVSALLARRGP